MACRIFSVGHVLIDMRVRVDEFSGSDLLSPIREISYGVGGSAANVAIGITRLGGSCTLVGKIGIDNFGRMVVDELMKENVSLDHVKADLVEKTGLTIVIINKKGDIAMYGDKGASDSLKPEDIAGIKPMGCEYVHIASLRMDTSIAAANLSKKSGLFVAFDPGRELATKGIEHIMPIFNYLDLLLMNSKEAKALTGYDEPEKACGLLRKAGVKSVIVKLGERGAYYANQEGEGTVKAFNVKAIDTTGAGDAFVTGLLHSLGGGNNFKEAVRYASAVAAIKVTRLGSHIIPNGNEVEEFLSLTKK